jgi:hypothetical protein
MTIVHKLVGITLMLTFFTITASARNLQELVTAGFEVKASSILGTSTDGNTNQILTLQNGSVIYMCFLALQQFDLSKFLKDPSLGLCVQVTQ